MKLKPVCRTLHRWIGAVSGVVVFVVCVTGALYAFKDEIEDATQPWKFVEPREAAVLLPSRVLEIAGRASGNPQPYALTYGEAGDALRVDYFATDGHTQTVFLDPYTGEVTRRITKSPGDFDFFRFVLDGHRRLWLPVSFGRPLVGWSVVAFVVALVSGLILWLPKKWNRKSLKRRLLVKWKAGRKRLNFDFHLVGGVYFAGILLLLSLTGLVWNMQGYGKALYRITGGGALKPYVLPRSDTLRAASPGGFPIDELYLRLRHEEPAATTFYLVIPQKPEDVCRVSIVHRRNSYYRTDNRFFDRYTLKELSGQGPYAGKYREAAFADKVRRMNLEIHDGRIAGLPGKILVFLAALAGAALPVTGWIMLWNRKRR